MASLKLNGVNKTYPSGSLALYDINFETKDKEFFVILGGEASGKTTLLRTVAGLDDVTSGEILFDGKNVTDEDVKDRDVAFVPRSSMMQASNVYDNLAYGLKIRKAPQTLIDQRVKAVSNILGLNEFLYRKPKTLTAAQKQRVAIGRVIIREPKLYLFDEPLSGLDEKLKAELLNVLINLQARMEGTFVYATKNVAEALTIGTRIAILKNGILQQIDTPANLYDYPANAYVAFLIGSPTVNLIHKAALVKEGEGVFVKTDDLTLPVPEKILNRFENSAEYIGTGKPVLAAVRPEDIRVGKEGIEAVAGEVNGNGGDIYAECSVGGLTLNAKSRDGVKKGEKVKLNIDCERLYLFDNETHLTLLARDGGYKKTEFADANYAPLTLQEEERVKQKAKPQKNDKRK